MKYTAYAFILFFTFFYGCKKNKRFKVNTDNVQIEISTVRFDKELGKEDTLNTVEKIKRFKTDYPEFFNLYTTQIIKIGSAHNSSLRVNLNRYISDSIYIQVFDTVAVYFKDTRKIEHTLADGFKRYHYFFPDRIVPNVYFMISGFNESVVVGRETLAISLEDYLGLDHVFYIWLDLYDYLKTNMYPEKIPSDGLWAWLQTEFQINKTSSNLLANMIHQGKILYILQQLLPHEPLNRILSYSDQQLNWCLANEAAIWRYIIEQKHLFSKNDLVIKKYTDQAPFTQFFGQESAPRAGSFTGFKIVSAYMKNNKEVTLPQLIETKDYQQILEKSGYKP